MRPSAPIAALVLAAAALAAAGCGQSRDRTQVRDVAQRFSAALSAGDDAAACALLDDPTRAALERQEQRSCARAIGGLRLSAAAVERVRVYVTNAQVELAGGEMAFLGRTSAGWRLSAVGCRWADSQRHDTPATCELEG